MNGKAFTILNTSCMSELSQIMVAKTLKNPYHSQTVRVKLSSNGKKTNILKEKQKKKKSYVFSGFGVSISLS